MNKIQVHVLNPQSVKDAEQMMVCSARLTQRGHQIHNLEDFLALYDRPFKRETVETMASLPHPTIQKFAVINVVVVGASRRFLAQITRHQNEVKFMSASLQYSDFSDEAGFAVPWEIIDRGEARVKEYLEDCAESMFYYKLAVADGLSNDTAGYLSPQALRNVLIISATPFQWKHMIGQRICNRNTVETKYVMELILGELFMLSPELFGDVGPSCTKSGGCQEGRMQCSEGYYHPDGHLATPQAGV